ncbi:MAG: thiamine-phosphate kinase [Alphaproteobacteria bacterium]|nr:thiamine-phosphate kinase [Alphaproteobacteria bacterium]
MSSKALDEFGRIASYFAPLAEAEPGTFNLTDDAAVMDFGAVSTVITADMLVADVHFFADDPADLVARKALRVNLSDLAAMAAEPVAYTLCLATPNGLPDAWVARFAEGLRRDQDEFGITLIGGDSVSTGGGPLSVSITAFGRIAEGHATRRTGAEPGDDVYVSGTIGDSALGLLALKGRHPAIAAGDRAFLADRFHLPQARTTLGPRLRGIAHAMMDVSDGLVQDAGHVANLSGVSICLARDDIPLSPAARHWLEADPEAWQAVLGGGDDYELLFTAPSGSAGAVAENAEAAGVPVSRIGKVGALEPGRDPEVQIKHPSGAPFEVRSAGYRHFSN